MRRLIVRALVATVVAIVGAGIIWGPGYARSAGLVIRAAGMQGWLRQAANAEAQPITIEPPVTIHTRHGPRRARLYRPARTIRRAAVVVPGVHAMGIDEPRLTGLAGDLAASGLAVLTLELPDLAGYEFTPRTPDEIEDGVAWLSARRDLARDGRVGLMGISFAGGLAVVAAGRPATRDRLAFVFSFGGHGEMRRALKYLCSGVEPLRPDDPVGTTPRFRAPHDYGVAVILLRMADRVVPADQVEPLRGGIRTFLTASQLTLVDVKEAEATFEEARRLVKGLPEPSASLMKMVNDRDTKDLGARLLPYLDDLPIPDALSPERSATPAAPVYLLHGTDDTVIPAVETLLLARHLADRTRVRYLLSGLITHAEVDRTATTKDVFDLVNFWAKLLAE